MGMDMRIEKWSADGDGKCVARWSMGGSGDEYVEVTL